MFSSKIGIISVTVGLQRCINDFFAKLFYNTGPVGGLDKI